MREDESCSVRCRNAAAARLQARVILITSYTPAPLDAEVAQRPFMHLLAKPFEYGVLLGLLHA